METTICDFCDEKIPEDEYINVHVNTITGEKKNYCTKCLEYFEVKK